MEINQNSACQPAALSPAVVQGAINLAGSALPAVETVTPEIQPAGKKEPAPSGLFDGIEPSELNPMYFCGTHKGRQVQPDMRLYDASPGSTNNHGQPVIHLRGVELISGAAPSIIISNSRLEPFSGPASVSKFVLTSIHDPHLCMLPPNEVIRLARHAVSGFRLRPDGMIEPSYLGQPLKCVEPCIVFRTNEPWDIGQAARGAQPFKMTRNSALYPLLGDLHANGEALREEQLARLGLAHAAMPASDEVAEALLKSAPGSQKPAGVAARLPMFSQGGRSLLFIASFPVPVYRTPEGGFEFAGEVFADNAVRDPSKKLHCVQPIAFQYVGAGIGSYVYHTAARSPEGLAALQEGESILKLEGLSSERYDFDFVQRHCYAGKSGIFLDQLHQSVNASPTGELATWERAIRNDQLLWRNGASMGSVTLASVPLIRSSELDQLLGKPGNMTAPEVRIAVRMVFEDTHRLDLLAGSGYGYDIETHRTIFQRLMDRDHGSFSHASRDHYLQRLAGNLGKNLAVLLKCGFALAEEQPLFDNLSIYGGLVDCDNYMDRKNRYEVLPMVEGFLAAFLKVSEAGGLKLIEAVQSAAWKELLCGAFGLECYQRVQEGMSHVSRSHSLNDFARGAAICLSADWALTDLVREQRTVSGRALLQRYCDDPLFRSHSDLPGDSLFLEEVRRALAGRTESGGFVEMGIDAEGKKHLRRLSIQEFAEEHLLVPYLYLALEGCEPSKVRKGKNFVLLPEIAVNSAQGDPRLPRPANLHSTSNDAQRG